MSELQHIPMFPLNLLPLPGELVPLHIFEPRYRQLLSDMEERDIQFGIYFNNELNANKLGAYMRLESVIKKYPGGESDIVVSCTDIFTMDKLMRTFPEKLYPGGDVQFWNITENGFASIELYELFISYQKMRKITQLHATFTIFQIACEANLDLQERYKFLNLPDKKQESFLVNRIKYQMHLLGQEVKSKDVFHLN